MKKRKICIVEGEKYVLEIPIKWKIVKYIITEHFADTNDLSLFSNRAPVDIVNDNMFKRYSDTVTPQGIIAIVKQKTYEIDDVLEKSLILIGENLQDPGTIGTLVRTIAATGSSLILTKDSCDIYNQKVVRASAGAIFRLPFIVNIDIKNIIELLKQRNIKIIASNPRNGSFLCDMKQPCAIIIGNESRGLTDSTISLADEIITLPMANETESLNAGIAGSVILYEAIRQRTPLT